MSNLLTELKNAAAKASKTADHGQDVAEDHTANDAREAAEIIERLPLLLKEAANDGDAILDVMRLDLFRQKCYTGRDDDLRRAAKVGQDELLRRLIGAPKIIAKWLISENLAVSVRFEDVDDRSEGKSFTEIFLVASGWK